MGTSLTSDFARPALALPAEPREYHCFYRAPRFRWWHSAVALVGFALLWAAGVLAATIA